MGAGEGEGELPPLELLYERGGFVSQLVEHVRVVLSHSGEVAGVDGALIQALPQLRDLLERIELLHLLLRGLLVIPKAGFERLRLELLDAV